MKIKYIRWSMTVIEMNGLTIITDPLFRILSRFLVPPRAYRIDQMPTPDLILVSHKHVDHWDPWAMSYISSISTQIPIIARPKNIADDAARLGYTDVRELQPYKNSQVGELTITAVPASHPGTEIGFVIQGEKCVYFAGDTSFDHEIFSKISERFDLDLVLLPIGGLKINGRINQIDPIQALDAIQLLHPEFVVGIHWGGLPSWLPFVKMDGTPRELARLVEETGLAVQVCGLDPLETIVI